MSNKAEKKQKREEKRQQAQRREKIQRLGVKGAAVILIPLVLYVFYQGLFGGAPIYPPDEIVASDHVQGAADASLTITMYADFQCPSCATEATLLAGAWPQISDRVRLVFRHYPLDTHAHSFEAAKYAEAAALQDMFWPMHGYLFNDQLSWFGLPDAIAVFDDYAVQIGLDLEQLRTDVESDAVREKILADQRGGTRAGVRGTPTLFFNGELVPNPQTSGELVQMVNQALSE